MATVQRALHTTAATKIAWLPFARLMVALGARVGRRVWSGWNVERRKVVKEAVKRNQTFILGGLGLASSCCVGYYYLHLEEAPVTKRMRFMLMDRKQMLEIMEKEKEAMITSATLGCQVLPSSHSSYAEVIPIIQRILPVIGNHWSSTDIEGVKWTLHILDNPTLANALCMPSGEIFIHSGLLKLCKNQDELALILSHEMAHVLMNHGGEKLSKRSLVCFVQLFLIAALWAVVPSDLAAFILHRWSNSLAEVLFHLPNSRELELEADEVGYLLSSSACFDPVKSIQIWSHFPTDPNAEATEEYLSTHPINENRLECLRKLLPDAQRMALDSNCKVMEMESKNFKIVFNKALKAHLNREK